MCLKKPKKQCRTIEVLFGSFLDLHGTFLDGSLTFKNLKGSPGRTKNKNHFRLLQEPLPVLSMNHLEGSLKGGSR
jgi:hypothetical protein